MVLSLLLGAAIGAILGLTGAGGGILAVPALVTGMGWPMQLAAPVALIAISGSAALGAIDAFRKRLTRYRAALAMAIAGIPMTAVGEHIAKHLSQRSLTLGFCCVMLFVVARLLREAYAPGRTADRGSSSFIARVDAHTGRFIWSLTTWICLLGTGAVTGLVTGLLGVGGGFIIVPLLRKLTNLAMHGIVATSLMVIALVGGGAVALMLLRGTVLPTQFVLWFAVSTAAGMVAGRTVSHHLDAKQVQVLFAIVLLCVSLAMLVKTIHS